MEDGRSLKGPDRQVPFARNHPATDARQPAAQIGDAVIIVADTDRAEDLPDSGRSARLTRQAAGADRRERLPVSAGSSISRCTKPIAETGKIEFSHNPFSMPQGGLEALNKQDPLTIKAFQYDIVCNGYELSSGAIRNHQPEIMYRAFEIAGYTRDEVNTRFKALINALEIRRAAARRDRAGHRPHRDAAGGRAEYPRSDHVPDESERGGPDDERAEHGASAAAEGAAYPDRATAREGVSRTTPVDTSCGAGASAPPPGFRPAWPRTATRTPISELPGAARSTLWEGSGARRCERA